MCYDVQVPTLAILSKLVCASVTIVACCWLLKKLYKLKPSVRKGSFCRLVAFLTFFDVLFATSCSVYVFLIELLAAAMEPTARFQMAIPLIYIFNIFRFSSLTCEVAIAAQCLLFSQRWRLDHRVHRFWVVIVLATGILAQFVLGFAASWHICPKSSIIAQPGRRALVAMAFFGTSVGCLSVLVYLFIMFTSYTQDLPRSVQRRRRQQLAAYPLNFLITYGLTFYNVLRYVEDPTSVSVWETVLSNDLELLGGFLNVVVYAWQCRLALHIGTESKRRSVRLLLACKVKSCDVEFGRVDVIEIPTYSGPSSNLSLSENSQTSSLDEVDFAGSPNWSGEFGLHSSEESHILPVYRENIVALITEKVCSEMGRTPLPQVKTFLAKALQHGLHPIEHDEILARYLCRHATSD